jgi:Flp pilus assembly protein TadB
MSGTTTEPITPGEITVNTIPAFADNRSVELSGENEHVLAADMARIVEQQVLANATVEKVEVRKAVQDITAAYTTEKNITLTTKQLRKLDRYTARLERKQQKKADVEWGPQNNLEIFLLAAALLGLVVGFFSSFGWFIFLVAALVYLYLKLLKI